MAKDWESFKDEYIEESVNSTLAWFKRIEIMTKSPIECIAYVAIVELSKEFHPGDLMLYPQYKIGKYTVDFYVDYRPDGLKIVVECDGHEFHEKTKQQAAHDKARDRFITKSGYTVLRYTGSEILNTSEMIYTDIYSLILKETDCIIS